MRSLRGACALAVVFALALIPFTASAKPPPVTINVVVSLTGPAAFLGAGAAQTMHILERTVNANGGIRGADVRFNLLDDQSSPQVAITLVNGLIAQKAQVILGPVFASTCGAVTPLVQSNAVDYCFSPAIHPEAGSFVYSAGMSTNDILMTAVRYFHRKGLQRVALITSTDASGIDAEHAFDLALAMPQAAGVSRVANEHFNPADISVAAQIARIKQAHPDVIFAWTTGTAFGTVLRSIDDAGLDLPIATSTGNMSYDQMKQLKQFATHNLYFTGFRYFDRENIGAGPLRSTVDQLFRAYHAANVEPDVQAGLSWDAGLLVVSALRALGRDATAAQIKAFVDGQRSFIGIDGLYDFPGVPQRGLNDKAAVMTRWDPQQSRWIVVSRPGGAPR